jgi:hypothetical protein
MITPSPANQALGGDKLRAEKPFPILHLRAENCSKR